MVSDDLLTHPLSAVRAALVALFPPALVQRLLKPPLQALCFLRLSSHVVLACPFLTTVQPRCTAAVDRVRIALGAERLAALFLVPTEEYYS